MKSLLAAGTLGLSLLMAPLAQAAVDPTAASAGTYGIDASHASLTLKISHMGFSNYTFRMNKVDATIDYQPKSPTGSSIKVSIDPLSVDTNNKPFDKEIGEKFFGGKTITFVSKAITQTGPDTGDLTGDLTLNGITKPVVLKVTFNKAGKNFGGKETLGFTATGVVKRLDFDVVKNYPAAVISDDVQVIIDAEFAKK